MNTPPWLLVIPSILIITAFVYLPVLKAGFVYDDLWFFTRNPSVRTLDVPSFFLDPHTAAALESGLGSDVYRPLGTLVFALAFKGWGLRAWPYHLLSLLLHLLNGILLWRILRALLQDSGAAAAGVAIFLLHPVQVQSVAWVSQLPALCAAAAFLAALNSETSRGWLAFAAAVLLKETTRVLPFISWLFPKRSARRHYLSGLFLIAAVYLVCRWTILHHLSQLPELSGLYLNSLMLGLLAFPLYLGKIILPIALRASYGYPTFAEPWVPATGIFLMFYVDVILYFYRREPLVMLALAWVLAALLPVLQIFPIRAFAAERFLYIPMMGAALLFGWLWKTRERLRPWLLLWIFFLTATSVMAVPTWHSEQNVVGASRPRGTLQCVRSCLLRAGVGRPAGSRISILSSACSFSCAWNQTSGISKSRVASSRVGTYMESQLLETAGGVWTLNMSMTRRVTSLWWTAWVFIVGCRIYALFHRYFDADELEHLHAAWCSAHGQLLYKDFFEHHGPLLALSLAPWISKMVSPFYAMDLARFGMLTMWGLTLWAAQRLAERDWKPWGSWAIVVFLWSFSTFSIKMLELRPDVPAACLVTLCLLDAWESIHD